MADSHLLAGRYRYLRELGRGASGRVLLAADEAEAGAERALKLVDGAQEARLRWEFGLLRTLAHPNLARVYELLRLARSAPGLDIAPGSVVLVTEYVPGLTAGRRAQALRGEALLSLTLEVALGAARALAAIHAQGLLHGDVKPDNLIVDEAGRCKLIDLGLAGAPQAGGLPSGTAGFMAPELFRGERGLPADLYALGATLEALLHGGSSTVSGSLRPAELLALALRPATSRRSLPGWVPAPLSRLLSSLLAPDAAERPASAREVVARLALIARDLPGAASEAVGAGADDAAGPLERAARLRALPCVGRDQEIAALAERLSRPGVVRVVGPPGAGRSRVVREAVGRLQTARVQASGQAPTYRVAEALPRAPLGADSVLHLTQASEFDVLACEAQVAAAEVEGAALTIVLEQGPTADGATASADAIQLRPLAERDIRRLLGAALEGARISPGLLREAVSVSAGLPGRLCRVLAAAAQAGVDYSRPASLRAFAARLPDASTLQPMAAEDAARELAEWLAVAGGRLPVELASELVKLASELVKPASERVKLTNADVLAEASASLRAHGLASPQPDGALSLRPDVALALWDELGSRREAIARRLAEAARRAPASSDGTLRTYVALALVDMPRALEEGLQEIARRREHGDPAAAGQLAQRLLQAMPSEERVQLALADALRAQGHYAAALECLAGESAVRPGGAGADLLRAELERLLGRRAEALGTLDRLPAASDPALSLEAAALEARLRFDAGELEAARASLQEALAGHPQQAALRAREVLALTLLHLGEVHSARAEVARALELARGRRDAAAESRLISLRGQLARGEGDSFGAARQFARAFELADAAGEQHAAASFLHNIGTQRLECGEPGPAVVALRESARRLTALGRRADVARVLYNLAYAAHLIGDDDVAQSAVRQAERAARASGDAQTAGFVQCLTGEIALRAGDRKAVTALLAQPPDEAALSSDAALSVAARRAALALGVGDTARAARELETARRIETAGPAAELERALALTLYALSEGELAQASERADHAQALSQAAGAFDARLRAALVVARVARAAGEHERAARHLSEVRSLLDQAAFGLTPAERARLRAVDVYRAALEAAPSASEALRPSSATAGADHRWRRLCGFAKRFAGESRLSRLYERVLDAAIELSGAERGFLVRSDREGLPRVRAGRGLSARTLASDEAALSRSIVGRVLSSGRPLATTDATRDERLSAAASVHALSLRSVLAVPLASGGEVFGALYLEDRLRPVAFGDDELQLLADLADLASAAIASAERLRAERRAARRLSALRAELARRVEAQALELDSLRRGRGEEQRSYPGIIAHSPAMQRVLQLVGRVARADVPVLVLGDSGTGKELVARAIHEAGERKAAAFIGENCGAIPEPLLESTLFGHVRGAFTGAEKRRLGLFEVADGGTLFLDEVGEMSPGMQAKLLRVLQDGQVRPVGSEQSRRVDVRVIAATHRDLGQMVEDGSFREDLYYRLAVVRLPLPPLRERPEDIAPLVAHFIEKYAQGRKVRIDRRALAALAAQPWPGNVRQLENEVRRALVLTDDVIEEQHFSFESREQHELPDELDLKAQIDRLERRLIRQALEATAGNQTRAAKMLGISRYGLQKMLRRLGKQELLH